MSVCVRKETPQPWPAPPILAPAVDQYWDSWDCHPPKHDVHTHPKVVEAPGRTPFFLALPGNVSQRKFEVHFRCESLQGFGGVLLLQGHTNTLHTLIHTDGKYYRHHLKYYVCYPLNHGVRLSSCYQNKLLSTGHRQTCQWYTGKTVYNPNMLRHHGRHPE